MFLRVYIAVESRASEQDSCVCLYGKERGPALPLGIKYVFCTFSLCSVTDFWIVR